MQNTYIHVLITTMKKIPVPSRNKKMSYFKSK